MKHNFKSFGKIVVQLYVIRIEISEFSGVTKYSNLVYFRIILFSLEINSHDFIKLSLNTVNNQGLLILIFSNLSMNSSNIFVVIYRRFLAPILSPIFLAWSIEYLDLSTNLRSNSNPQMIFTLYFSHSALSFLSLVANSNLKFIAVYRLSLSSRESLGCGSTTNLLSSFGGEITFKSTKRQSFFVNPGTSARTSFRRYIFPRCFLI